MRLSVLIPTYNYDCTQLVAQLKEQLSDDDEIIVGNDNSSDKEILEKLYALENLDKCRIYCPNQREEGARPIGRAAIRNTLAREAQGRWLLFIDADAEVSSKSFIENYIAATAQANVICGGTGNLPECPRPEAKLRYNYEVSVERRLTLPKRQSMPYAQFTTFNFLIRRDIFLSICFDENLHEYGHEDTAFGLELQKRAIDVLHICNKLTHLGIENADIYLAKTETALRTLASLDICRRKHMRVSAFSMKLEHYGLLGVVHLLYKVTRPLLRSNLLGKHPSQVVFTFYKLGYFTDIIRSSRMSSH